MPLTRLVRRAAVRLDDLDDTLLTELEHDAQGVELGHGGDVEHLVDGHRAVDERQAGGQDTGRQHPMRMLGLLADRVLGQRHA